MENSLLTSALYLAADLYAERMFSVSNPIQDACDFINRFTGLEVGPILSQKKYILLHEGLKDKSWLVLRSKEGNYIAQSRAFYDGLGE